MTILEACTDPKLFARWFAGDSWRPWRVFLAALFGLPLDSEADAALFAACSGRTEPQTAAAREAWAIVGRRGGKSRVAALVAVYLACFRDYRAILAPGEVGTVAVIAADRRQARTIMRYIGAFFDAVPMLRRLAIGRTKESIELSNQRHRSRCTPRVSAPSAATPWSLRSAMRLPSGVPTTMPQIQTRRS